MKTLFLPIALAVAALSGCANTAGTDVDAAAPAQATPAATPPAATDPAKPMADSMPAMTAEEHAAMDASTGAHADSHAAGSHDGAMATTTQAGWYSAGTFRTCGNGQGMKVDKPAEIDAQIKAGGMSSTDPVYVQLEGMAMGDGYMLTKVVQVGSKTPVRDCPMTGTLTQVGG